MPVKLDNILPLEIIALLFSLFILIAFSIYVKKRDLKLQRFGLFTLRTFAIVVLFILLLSPYLIAEIKTPERPVLTVLADNSQSVQLPERKEQINNAMEKIEGLKSRYIIQTCEFGEQVLPYSGKQRPQIVTAIGSALAQVQGNEIVLISDGQNNAGIDPREAAAKAKSRVHTLAIGTNKDIKDQRIDSVNSPKEATVGSKIPIVVYISSLGFENTTTRLVMKIDDIFKEDRELSITKSSHQERVEFTFEPKETGLKRITFNLEEKEGEINKYNNTCTTFIDVTDIELKIYFLQGRPRWEDKYLIRQLSKLKDCSVHVSSIDKELSDFDPQKFNVLIISDVPESEDKKLAKLDEILAAKGLGIILIPSPDMINFRDPTKTKYYLHQICPVHLGILSYNDGKYSFVVKKAGAEIMQKTEDGSDLVVMHKYSNSNIAFVATDVTYRWFLESDQSQAKYKKFWHQIMLWTTRKEEALDVTLEKFTFRPKEVVKISVKEEATIKVTSPDTKVYQYFGTRIEFTPNDVGIYKVHAQIGKKEKILGFYVRHSDAESENLSVDKELLNDISKITGGKFFDTNNAAEMISWLSEQAKPEFKTRFEKQSLVESPILVLAFVFFLSLEWMIRRIKGLK